MSKRAIRNLSKARLAGLATLLGAFCSSGCQFFRSASSPIPHVAYRSPGNDAETLVVLLPGIDSRAADFAENGWVEKIHAAAPRAAIDLAAREAYAHDTALVGLPARAAGLPPGVVDDLLGWPTAELRLDDRGEIQVVGFPFDSIAAAFGPRRRTAAD